MLVPKVPMTSGGILPNRLLVPLLGDHRGSSSSGFVAGALLFSDDTRSQNRVDLRCFGGP